MKHINEIIEIIPVLIISMFGGLANQVYKVTKGEVFKRSLLLLNLLLSAFVGYILSGFIPKDSGVYGPLIAMSGFCAFPILSLIEKKFPDFISKYIK